MKTKRTINRYIILLAFTISFNSSAQVEESFKQLIIPESGIWWNSSQPGTGISMQFNRDGKWFAAMYLYHNYGHPIFLTMQGSTIEYSLDRTGFENRAYAKVTSQIYRSSEGRCLGCVHVVPETEVIPNIQGEILFINKGHAVIKISGDINYEEEIKSNLFVSTQILDENNPNTRNIIFRGNGYHVNILAIEKEGISVTGLHPYYFECIDCNNNQTALNLIENLGYSAGHSFTLGIKSNVNNEFVNYNYVNSSDDYVGINYIYGIVDEKTAINHGLPTQIIIQQSIHH